MLHSGSRGTGNLIGTYFIEKAREELARRVLGFHLPDKDRRSSWKASRCSMTTSKPCRGRRTTPGRTARR